MLLCECSYLPPSIIQWCLTVPAMIHAPAVFSIGILAFLLLTSVENKKEAGGGGEDRIFAFVFLNNNKNFANLELL